MPAITEAPDSNTRFNDDVFMKNNAGVADEWVSITKLYPSGVNQPLLPATFSTQQFGQGYDYECFMLSALSTLVRFPEVIRHCFVTKKVRQDGRYTFQFFRGREWVKVEIDDKIALSEGDVLYVQSPTEHWWPLLLEKAYAKFYNSYDHLQECTLQETFHDLTGHPVLNIPMDVKLAKAAGCEVTEGAFWLDLGQKIRTGEYVASTITRDTDVEELGLQPVQQYGILEVFSLTGTSALTDIVIHMYNPFEDEEYIYKGPLNPSDGAWTSKLRAKYDVENPRNIFLPLNLFLKIMNSMQLCLLSSVESEATYYADEWKGETAGGNPANVTWRKNPLYYISNMSTEPANLSFVIKQSDERRFLGPTEKPPYKQCGMILSQYVYTHPIPTFWVTGNNHKAIHKSLFLNAREVANQVRVPPNSLCYLVPSCMSRNDEAKFDLAVYRMRNESYSNLTIKKLEIPEMDWANPVTAERELHMRVKERMDFYVDVATDAHILMQQQKPYISKVTGGDSIAEDYLGLYLYDDLDRKISSVHAATNYREISLIHHLPRSGRYALSATCPRGKGAVPIVITIVTSRDANCREVDPPADADALPDENDEIDEGEGAKENRIDYDPINLPKSSVTEPSDSTTPFEDRAFTAANAALTKDPWVHIGDLYPEGKTQPLLPATLSRDQFEQGEHHECCCLTAFASLVENHPDVIRNCFVSKKPRKDGRYTFQFNRYGQWVKVEIDDRIPQVNGQTLYCRSPTRHWWPLLLEKALAKFYTMYANLEGCTHQELMHDMTGNPVVSFPMDPHIARSANVPIHEPSFWLSLRDELGQTALAARTGDGAEDMGMSLDEAYAILDIAPAKGNPSSLADIIIKMHNPFIEDVYCGPLHSKDPRWPGALKNQLRPEEQNVICMPADVFCDNFLDVQQARIKGLAEPSWHFNSEWGEGTSGGNPTLVTWRQNPLYVVRNDGAHPVEIFAMIRQPDRRHLLHTLPDGDLTYIRCGLVLSESQENKDIPTYLVTGNNHVMVHRGIFLNSREVADRIVIPAKSLSYLVPSAMHHERSMFLLSYWYRNAADERGVKLRRLQVDVARRLPAVAHVNLPSGGKDRVDFLVDCATDAHILLSQLKTTPSSGISDAQTRDFLGVYLYDDRNERVTGVSAATNFREIGLVARLPAAGRYTLSLTCRQGEGEVPCRVEVVCVEPAHVRITDAPEDAKDFSDMEFEELLPAEPYDPANPEKAAVPTHPTSTAQAREVEPPRADEAAKPVEELPVSADKLDLSFLEDEYLGIPKEDLQLRENPAFLPKAMEREKLKKNPAANASRINVLEDDMHKIAEAVAAGMHTKERGYLDKEPEGVPLALLPLNEDPPFSRGEDELRAANKNPQKNAKAIRDLEGKLNDRAHELAKQLKDKERDLFLNPMPLGVPIATLPIDEDTVFHPCEIQRLVERQKDPRNEAKIRDLNNALNDRAQELARKKLDGDRDYLEPEHLHIPNDELPLADNREFAQGEAKRQQRKADPRPNAAAIKQLEDDLNALADKIAADELAKQRPAYLEPEYRGRALEDLPLNEDDPFLRKEQERRDELKKARPDNRKVAKLEGELQAMADDMAKRANEADRSDFMKPTYRGIPRDQLPLDNDPELAKLEEDRARRLRSPEREADAIRALEDAINRLADELAKRKLRGDRGYLDPYPEGVPVALLPLDADPAFRRLEDERADLLSAPHPDRKAVADVEDKLNERARELAKEYKSRKRPNYTVPADPTSPWADVSLDNDLPFTDMEGKMFSLVAADPIKNREQIEDLQDALYKRSKELEKQRKQRERAFLDPYPLGLPLDEIGLDGDKTFLDLENQLRAAKKKNDPDLLKALQDAMQDRAYELAAEELLRRYPKLDPEPEDVPILDLREEIARDEPFWETAKKLDDARRAAPTKNKAQVAALEQQLNDRLEEIAKAKKQRGRGFLDPNPENYPLEKVDLDADRDFTATEQQRNDLLANGEPTDSDRIAALEKEMQAIANRLAAAAKWKEREAYLDPYPEGVPLRDVPLDESPEFLAKEAERRRLIDEDPRKNAAKIRDLEKQLNDLAHELAKQQKHDDRVGVLGEDVNGVPVDQVGLDKDPEYAALEKKWYEMANDPRASPKALQAVEDQMRDRAEKLAEAAKWDDREKYLDPYPEGVPLRDVPLDESPEFLAKEAERRRLIDEDPRKNAAKIRDLERQLNDLAHELAKQQKHDDRVGVLGEDVNGVPVDQVGLDKDPEYAALEKKWYEMANDPRASPKALQAVEDQMRDRAEKLAEAAKWDDREKYLDPYPEGVPLRNVPLDESPEFLAKEAERRRLIDEDPRKNAAKIRDLEKQLNDLAHELAKQQKHDDRVGVLGEDVNGVPVDQVGLDKDPEYAALEKKWYEMANDPRASPKALQALEDQMRDRAEKLAEAAKWDDREKYLDPYPEGVPLRNVPLDESPEFLAKEAERRRLIDEDPRKNAAKIRDLEKQLNDLAHELAKQQKHDDRVGVLGEDVNGVPVDQVGLDKDPEYAALEKKWYEMANDPRASPKALQALEDQMRDRAEKLAEEIGLAGRRKDRGLVLEGAEQPQGAQPSDVLLEGDPEYDALEKRWDAMRKDPRTDAKALRDIEEQMRRRAKEIAEAAKWDDREKYLDPYPEGVPLRNVPLDESPEFLAKEAERRRLIDEDPRKNAAKIRDLEKQLNDLAHELAKEKKWKDRKDNLENKPEGIPLEEVGLDEDPEFRRLEDEWQELVAEDPRKNAARLEALRRQMDDRAHELAKAKKHDDRVGVLGEDVNGVPVDQVGLDKDPEYAALEKKWYEMANDPRASPKALQAVEDQMRDRAEKLAEAAKWDDREKYLDPYPEGVPLRNVPLDESPEFLAKEAERRRLIDEDPRKNAAKIRDLERQLNDLAHELAKQQKHDDRVGVLGEDVNGVPVDQVGLDKDPEYAALEKKWYEMANDPRASPKALQAVEDQMRDRAEKLAEAAKWDDREKYLDPYPEGVPLRNVPLDESPEFLAKEAERRRLIDEDPRKNAAKIRDLEKQLNDLAHELAKQQKHDDRVGVLGEDVNGVPVDQVGLDKDPEYAALEKKWYEMANDPRASPKALQAVEDQMRDRAEKLAEAAKWDDREKYLDPYPEGVPLRNVPLDESPEFLAKEAERRRLIDEDPRKNAAKIRDLEKQLNDLAHELAKQQKHDDRVGVLGEDVNGVPVDQVGLDKDPEYAALEKKWYEMANDPRASPKALQALEDQMRDRAEKLAEAAKWDDREKYLDPYPEGVPLRNVPLDESPEFLAKEAERRRLIDEDPRKNAAKIRDLERQLNDLAHELAKQQKHDDRVGVLGEDVNGVPVDQVGLDKDPEYAALEKKWYEMANDPRASPKALQAVEDQMRDRAEKLAEAAKWDDREKYLDPYPEGVPLRNVPLDESPEFLAKEAERRRLIDEDPRKNAAKIRDLEKQLNDLAHELAKQQKHDDRVGVLGEDVNGVPVDQVGLDKDPEYAALEKKWYEMANDPRASPKALQAVEDQMRDRAEKLAEAAKWDDREKYLDPYPEGVPLRNVPLDESPEFLAKEAERRRLIDEDPRKNAAKIRDLEKQLNDLAHELAKQQKHDDRVGVLGEDVNGVPVDQVGLDKDPEYAALEKKWYEMANDPRASPKALQALEDQMRDRAEKLAEEIGLAGRRKDRGLVLEGAEQPQGAQPSDVLLEGDPEYDALEKRWDAMRKDPRTDAKALRDIEEQMRRRAKEIAEAAKWDDREKYLDPYPEGVPLRNVPLDESPEFLAKEAERRRLIDEDPRKNAAKIRDLEKQLNDLAHELAKEKKWKDRKDNLENKPEGIPLEEVGLDEDPEFRRLEDEWQELVAEDPRKNAARLEALRRQMDDRAHELAKAKKHDDRVGVLGEDVNGVPVDQVGLDKDPEYAALEKKWYEMANDPRASPKALQAVEDQMRDRAEKLAEAAKWDDREKYLDPYPEGVPLRNVPLDESPEFLAKEAERRRLIDEDPRKNAAKIRDLEKQLNDLAHELAKQQKHDDRVGVLGEDVNGVPVDQVGLDKDPEYAALEKKWYEMANDPRASPKALQAVEDQMRDRAEKLAEAAKWDDREKYLDPYPEGVPLRNVPLDESPEFLAKEAERRRLIDEDPRKNAAKIRDLEKQLNDLAHELAKEKKWKDRKDNLENKPEGIPLEEVGLDEDPEFRRLEDEWQELVAEDPRKNAARLEALRRQMDDRAHELAKAKKHDDRVGVLGEDVNGVPVDQVGLDKDPEYAALEKKWYEMANDPRASPKALQAVEDQMRDRAEKLAEAAKWDDREKYLDPYPEGVPLRNVPLDESPEFLAKEAERRRLIDEDPRKNAAKIRDLEKQLNDLAHELAKQQKHDDRVGVLGEDVNGVPVDQVGLDKDPEYAALEKKWYEMANDPRASPKALQAVEDQMRDRAEKLAEAAKWDDREKYLDPYPEGVPLRNVPLDESPEFLAKEAERRRLIDEDPRKNAAKIRDLEKQLNDLAHELAKQQKHDDRVGVLGEDVNGVPVDQVGLDKDPEYAALEKKWYEMANDPRASPKALQALEDQMRDRAEKLAEAAKWDDREKYLDPYPEGVPLRNVPLDESPEFLAKEAERRRLIDEDPRKNAAKIRDLEKQLNDLAHELAKEKKWKDRKDNLENKPEGIPLEEVGLDEDPEFRRLEDEWQELVAEDPRKNAVRLEALRGEMEDRAHELAEEAKRKGRERFRPHANKLVDFTDVPLDEDPEFRRLEDKLLDELQKPQPDRNRVEELEYAMGERVKALSDAMVAAERQFLDPRPEDIPIEEVPLDEDPEFLALEAQRRQYIDEDPRRNGKDIVALEDAMNARSHELAKAEKERRWAFLPRRPEEVPIELVGLDEDPEFRAMEKSLAALRTNPDADGRDVRALEQKMVERAEQLARKRRTSERERILGGDVPWERVPLDEDPDFRAMEAERYDLMVADPVKYADRIANLEDAMRERAQGLADGALGKSRGGMRDPYWTGRGYLDPEPEYIPLEHVPLDEDTDFRNLEDQLFDLLQDPKRNAAAISEMQKRLNDRAHELAKGVQAKDFDALQDEYGIFPARDLGLHTHPSFRDLANKHRAQQQQRHGRPPIPTQKEIDADMDRFAQALADRLMGDEYGFLDSRPEGVPLENLGIFEDPVFTKLDERRKRLNEKPHSSNSDEVKAVQKKMNDRVHVLAKKRGDEPANGRDPSNAPSLQDRYQGVPLGDLEIEDDPELQAMLTELGRQQNDPTVSPKTRRGLENAVNNALDKTAADQLRRERAKFLPNRVDGVPLEELPLNTDPIVNPLEHELRRARKNPRYPGEVQELENRIQERVKQLADDFNRDHRAFLPQEPEGVPLEQLGLNDDPSFQAKEKELRRLQAQDPYSEPVEALKQGMTEDVHRRAKDYLHKNRPEFLPSTVGGVPLGNVNNVLDGDPLFRALEAERNRLAEDPKKNAKKLRDVEDKLRDRAEELAKTLKDDPRSGKQPRVPLSEVEERVRKDVREVIEPEQGPGAYPADDEGWQDPSFQGNNDHVADEWPRIGDLYPEGLSRPLLPENPNPADVASMPGDLTYLAPFLAALSRQPPLLLRLFNTRAHPVNSPYSFVFFDPNSNPVEVEVDDRVPCDASGNPKFTVSPNHEWWPLLVEKAYAKYVGGYERMDDCTSHETLHDLTGRPVTHLPLEPKLAEEVPGCHYRDPRFWRDVKENLDKGDVYIAVSNPASPDGIHPQCYYAVFDIFETVPGSNDPADMVVKVHNCYQDAPHYNGPLHARDPKWNPRLRSVCGNAAPAEQPEFLYVPQPVFLRNFSSMQRCHIGCGDRLTVSGEWDEQSSGGNPKYTTFRTNPIYLVENKSSRPVTVLAELRHAAPVFYDANHVGVYHQTALAVLRPENHVKFVAPLLAYNTHKFLQKGLLTDAREVCSNVELPANSTCYLVPYTKKKGCYGKYQLSIYPQEQPVNFTTLRPIELTHNCITTEIVVRPGSGEGSRADFSVSEPCDVHILLHQDKITDPASVKRGNHLAEDEIMMAAYEDNTMLIASTGDASNAREHALTFQATKPGRYTLLVGCPAKPVTGDCPVTISVYTPRQTQCKWIAVPAAGKQGVAPRLALPPVRPSNGAASTPNGIQRQAPLAIEPRRPSSATNSSAARNPRTRGYSQ